jgi:hypothetical protein
MANPVPAYFSIRGDSAVDSLTTGYYWRLDQTRVVDFSISQGFSGEYWNAPTQIAQSMAIALNTFSYYANVRFNYLGQFASPLQAGQAGSEINLSMDGVNRFFSNNDSWAIGFFPAPSYQNTYPGYATVAGDIYLNLRSAANSLPSYEPGSQGWFLLLHELGHALGLKHPHDSGGTARPTFAQLGIERFDSDTTTIMSYNDDANWNTFNWDPATPMILDVIALQALYGKNQQTNAGNTVHKLSENNFYLTLWDASGIDALDISSNPSGWTIVMPNQGISSLVDTRVGIAAPTSDYLAALPRNLVWLAGDYERIIGSRFADQLTGNDFNNVFVSNGGNDVIRGGNGIDTVMLSGSAAQYRISTEVSTASSTVVTNTVQSFDRHTLTSIERLQFADVNLALDTSVHGHAGQAVLLLSAVLPGQLALDDSKLSLVGSVITLLDQGFTVQQLAGAVLRLPIWDILTAQTNSGSADVASYLARNVYGSTANDGVISDAILRMGLESGATQGNYLSNLALSAANQERINLVGINQTGLEYLL